MSRLKISKLMQTASLAMLALVSSACAPDTGQNSTSSNAESPAANSSMPEASSGMTGDGTGSSSFAAAKLEGVLESGMAYADFRKLVLGQDWTPMADSRCKEKMVGAKYQQSYEQLRQLDPKMLGFTSDRDYQNAAATLAFEARVSGLAQVDHVVPSGNGAGLIAVKGRLDDPAHSRLYVDKAQAASQPLQQSTRQVEQDARQQAQQTLEAPRQPEPRQQPDAQAPEPRRMAMI